MDPVRRASFAAIFLVLAVGLGLAGAGGPSVRSLAAGAAAAVSWPVSTLVLSELETGAASASDEFVELTNAGTSAVDLAGLEVVYVTSSGGTVTRKASWTASTPLEPGRHLLLANSLGIHAPVADTLYSGGLSATGGTLLLRRVGGSPIDAVGWGDATNAFVEGLAAPPPPAGASLERRPGGIDGNSIDTNDNLADWLVQPVPNPQPLAAPPVPVPTVSPTVSPTASAPPSASPGPSSPPTSTPSDGPSPSPTLSPEPSSAPPATPSATPGPTPTPPIASPSVEPSVQPTALPTATPTPGLTAAPPSPAPTATPEPTATPSPTPPPTPTPTPTPTPSYLPIAQVRALADGTAASIQGTLTTPLGLLEDGRSAFVQDGSAGIAIYLDVAPATTTPAGTVIRASGTVDERYGARTLRVTLTLLDPVGVAPLPSPLQVVTGAATEGVEGLRISVTGWTSGSPTAYADGTGLLVDDGSGPVRAIVAADALSGQQVPSGTLVTVTGPLGQRDSSGTGTTGYRLFATQPGDLALVAIGPSPSPSPTPAPSAFPSDAPSATPAPTFGGSPAPIPSASPSRAPTPLPSSSASGGPTPTASPTPTPTTTPAPTPTPATQLLTIGDARTRPLGSVVQVMGTVTAEAGRLGTPALLAIEDATGAVVVHLDDEAVGPPRGTRIEVRGELSAPYGQLEIKAAADGLRAAGTVFLPIPLPVRGASVGEATEARLVTIDGTVAATPTRSSSHDIAFDLVDVDGARVRIMADASSGLVTTSVRAGQAYRLIGIAGQRASRKGALDGYRIWLRDVLDVNTLTVVSQGPTSGALRPAIAIASALPMLDASVVIEGTVTAPAALLDTSGRRIVVQDATGAIELLVPVGVRAPSVGAHIRAEGVVGRAYGAPRLQATNVEQLATRSTVDVVELHGPPDASDEWRLVRVSGTFATVTRLGTRWRAELEVDGARLLVDGLPGSGIPSTAIVAGHRASVTAIVRRPYPGATDQRFGLLPRTASDVGIAGSPARGSEEGGPSEGEVAAGDPAAGAGGSGGTSESRLADLAPDVDLAALGEHPGELVRVGGLVQQADAAGFSLDDGTAVGTIRLSGDAAAYLGLIEPGDAINAMGVVVAGDGVGDWEVLVSAADGLVRVGDLGQPLSVAAGREAFGGGTGAAAAAEDRAAGQVGSRLGLGSLLPDWPGGTVGLVSLVLFSALSLAGPAARRRRARRLADVRTAGRLATYVGGPRDPA